MKPVNQGKIGSQGDDSDPERCYIEQMRSGSEESRLIRAAAAGDGPAFACLYEEYERRIFNYLLRLLGDRHEAEDATQDTFIKVMGKLPELGPDNLQFGPYLYTAARNAGYDVIARRKKMEPTGAVPVEAEAPFRGELSDLEMDPERSVLAGSQEAAVRSANDRLPDRQREVLTLRELDGMSYDEIGSVMEMKPNAVAQLISRARIGLRKEMQAGAAASVAFASPDCERAHGELACRQDGQVSGLDESWLDGHLASCANCRVAGEEMAEAGVSYRAWAPVVPAAWLFREVMAKASETIGFDWSGVERPGPDAGPDAPGSQAGGAPTAATGGKGRRAVLVGLGSVLVAAVFAGLLLAEANAPERVSGVNEAVIEPVSGKKMETGKKSVAKTRGKGDREGNPGASADEATGLSGSTASDVPQVNVPSGSGNPGPGSGQQGGGGNSNPNPTRPSNPDSGPEPVDPVEPSNPTVPRPEPEPVPDPRPEPTPPTPTPPIPGGPPGLAIPGGPTPG